MQHVHPYQARIGDIGLTGVRRMARGIPIEVSMTAERHRLVRERSRISVEIDLIDEWCQALHPKYFTSPQSDSPEIDGIEFEVHLTEGTLFENSTRVPLIISVPNLKFCSNLSALFSK